MSRVSVWHSGVTMLLTPSTLASSQTTQGWIDLRTHPVECRRELPGNATTVLQASLCQTCKSPACQINDLTAMAKVVGLSLC